MRNCKQQARAWLWASLVPLTSALGSCGGNATSHPQGATAGATDGATSASSAGKGGAGASSAGANGAGTSSAGARNGGAGGVGTGGAGTSGAADGGAAGDNSSGGMAGSGACVDVCALRGAACCIPSVSCVSPDASCVIDVFDTMVSISSDYATLAQRVASMPENFMASLTTADIESAAADPRPAARIELHLSAPTSSLYGAALEGAFGHPFRVSCDGQSLFVGQVYMLEGAAGLQTPVLHVVRDADDSLILELGAWQGAWALPNPNGNVPARERIDRPELRATLCLNSALPEL